VSKCLSAPVKKYPAEEVRKEESELRALALTPSDHSHTKKMKTLVPRGTQGSRNVSCGSAQHRPPKLASLSNLVHVCGGQPGTLLPGPPHLSHLDFIEIFTALSSLQGTLNKMETGDFVSLSGAALPERPPTHRKLTSRACFP
jgi:hypothetical protein